MELKLVGHDDLYAVEQLQMALFSPRTEGTAVSALYRAPVYLTAVTTVTVAGKTTRSVRRLRADGETVRRRRQLLQQSYYLAALPHLPAVPSWGAMAGVRPTKVTTRHLLEGGTQHSADALLKDIYYVTPSRRKLALQCSASSVAAAGLLEPRDLSLYVGIPFCPSRCSYCSFVSSSVGKRKDLIAPYLDALCRELELTGRLMETSGYHVRTIYIGGGTPTTLTAEQLKTLMGAIGSSFDMSRCLEFTVEGGRPDTIDAEKLETIRACGADRMSINPQSMHDEVLRACARPHTAKDILRCYSQARDAGFDAINMDLIAGLPTDNYAGFCRSLDAVADLLPENITVHTLALKKGSDLFEGPGHLCSAREVARMVDHANETLRHRGYRPYYLYRQKYMTGSFENVGWCRDGKDCLYNIYMMEELHTVVSLGGAGMTKLTMPDGSLQRFHNPKFPEQYIDQLDSVLAQKHELFRQMEGSV